MIIKSFFEQGHVKLEEMKNDRRNKKIILTKCGKKYVEDIILPLWDIDEKATMLVDEANREIFLKCIDVYEQSFRAQIENLPQK